MPISESLVPGHPSDELAATVALIRTALVPAQRLGTLIDEVGSAVRIVQLSEKDRLFAWPETAHDLIGGITDADIRYGQNQVLQWRRETFSALTVLDSDYPGQLHEIFNRPPLLFIRGSKPAWVPDRSIAVVGARAADARAKRVAQELTADLVEAGFTILSGLAKGIDTVAHETALEGGGTTLAVLGTGLYHVYPQENVPLADRILDSGGCLISQFLPDQAPTRWTFPMRNVVMSGLSSATVVVEASETSGARLQARVALQHGRSVFLYRDLVAAHPWAQKYVTEGAYGTRAVEITTAGDILAALTSSPDTLISTAA